jgi:hypothetical protein
MAVKFFSCLLGNNYHFIDENHLKEEMPIHYYRYLENAGTNDFYFFGDDPASKEYYLYSNLDDSIINNILSGYNITEKDLINDPRFMICQKIVLNKIEKIEIEFEENYTMNAIYMNLLTFGLYPLELGKYKEIVAKVKGKFQLFLLDKNPKVEYHRGRLYTVICELPCTLSNSVEIDRCVLKNY